MRVISGTARGTVLKTPNGQHTRPTADRVKEAMFSIIQFDLPGSDVLDLFGGSGQLGIEALSRGASSAVFVDSRADACVLIRENLRRCNFSDRGQVVHSDYLDYLKRSMKKFHIILLDPPYCEVFLENSLKLITEIDILQSGGIIVTEHASGKSLDACYEGIHSVKSYKYGNTTLTVFRKD